MVADTPEAVPVRPVSRTPLGVHAYGHPTLSSAIKASLTDLITATSWPQEKRVRQRSRVSQFKHRLRLG
jgi:hypothetical protein